MPEELLEAKKFSISYCYLSPEDYERVQTFRRVSGDKEAGMYNQFVRGYIGVYRSYFYKLAKLDIAARGIDPESWVDIILAKGMEGMPPYQREIREDEIPKSPLAHIIAPPAESRIQRGLNYFVLSAQNMAFFRVGIYYDRDSASGYTSRIIHEHFVRNWEKLYVPQVNAARSKSLFLKENYDSST